MRPHAQRKCEVLVVGAGVAGVSAAIAAAREGAHTILVEKKGFPGGIPVIGLHRAICGLYSSGASWPESTLNDGIAEEICSKLRRAAPHKTISRMGMVYVFPFAAEDLVSVLRAMIRAENKLEVLYDTTAVSVTMGPEARNEPDSMISANLSSSSFPTGPSDSAGPSGAMDSPDLTGPSGAVGAMGSASTPGAVCSVGASDSSGPAGFLGAVASVTVRRSGNAEGVESESPGRSRPETVGASCGRDASGLSELEIIPRTVVDCSGDAIIAQLSGARFDPSPPSLRQLAGFSFRVSGLRDVEETLALKVPYHLSRGVAEEAMPFHLKYTVFSAGDAPDEGYCKLSVPAAPEADRNERAREAAVLAHRYLARVLPPFRDSFISCMSSEVVDREGPRVRGEYVLTADDVIGARKFPDGVVKNAWPIELWEPDKGVRYRYLESGEYYEIPLRCLAASDVSNLYCAGRCISASREALGSTRVMGACISLGEQAGRAAARRRLELPIRGTV